MNFCRAALGAVLLSVGCARGHLETATEPPRTTRPGGFTPDLVPALPLPSDRAEAKGVLALREPFADREVEALVRAYVRAFEREDLDALVELLAQEATSLGRGGGKAQLVDLWRARLNGFEYQKLAGLEIARFAKIDVHTYESLADSARPARPNEMRPSDVYVRVPMATARASPDPLFGDVLVLLLRRENGRLKIAGQADESGR